MAKKNHAHKFRRHTYESTGQKVYFCTLDCDFRCTPALALGKRAICNRCGREFVMNEYSIRLAKPHCTTCHKAKDAIDVKPTELREVKEKMAETSIDSLRERLRSTANEVAPIADEDIEI